MEDQNKIDKILKTLNGSAPREKWVWEQVEGFHSLMTAIPPSGSMTPAYFNGSNGVIVKSFINTETGEIKTFYYKKVTR
jgi:hypothetical protein